MGIPQGSVLSGLLCNYYFGYIERSLIGDILQPTSSSRAGSHIADNTAARSPRELFQEFADESRDSKTLARDADSSHCPGRGAYAAPSGDHATESGRQTEQESARPFMSPSAHSGDDFALLRQVDDFLVVTTNKAKAEAFVQVMHDQSKTSKWAFSIHEAKVSVVSVKISRE